jgi:hypothetical protein
MIRERLTVEEIQKVTFYTQQNIYRIGASIGIGVHRAPKVRAGAASGDGIVSRSGYKGARPHVHIPSDAMWRSGFRIGEKFAWQAEPGKIVIVRTGGK